MKTIIIKESITRTVKSAVKVDCSTFSRYCRSPKLYALINEIFEKDGVKTRLYADTPANRERKDLQTIVRSIKFFVKLAEGEELQFTSENGDSVFRIISVDISLKTTISE